MKNLLAYVFVFIFFGVDAQSSAVGINTVTPSSTLDVRGRVGSNGKSLTNETTGMQAPRLTLEELTLKGDNLYGSNHKGTMIYITDLTSGTAQNQRVNINSVGYYYFDGAVWLKMMTKDKDTNLFNSNGVLTGLSGQYDIRTLGLNGYAMQFLGSDEGTYWSPYGSLSQINQKGTGGSSTIMLAGGNNALLSLQQFYGSNSQIYASNNATALMVGTNGNNASAPIKFVTSSGMGASGTEKAIITGEGKMGIGQPIPKATLHVTRPSNDVTPIIIEGCREFANNTEAASAGVPIGGVYRTGEFLKVRY